MIAVVIATVAGCSALNVWFYAKTGSPFNLAIAVFCALSAICCAVIAR